MGFPAAVQPDWMLAERSERVERLRAFYEGRGLPAGKSLGLAKIHADEPLANLCGDCGPIFRALGSGESVATFAARLGVERSDVYGYLIEHSPVEWARWSAGRAAARLDKADEDLEVAEEQVEVSRLSQISRNAQWQLERMAPRLYAAKGESGGVTINVVLDPSCGGVVIDQTRVSGAEASGDGRAD